MFNFDKTLQLYWLIDAACVFIVLLIPMIYRAIAQRQRTYRFKRRKPFRVRHANSNTANDECSAENIPLINIKSQRKPEWVLQETLRLKVLMGQAGCRKITLTFNRLHGSTCTIGKGYVAMSIKQHQYKMLTLRRAMRAQQPHNLPVNHTWAMDLSFVTDDHKNRHTILGTVDHGSRLALQLNVLIYKCAWTLLGHLCLSIGKHGKPKRLRTDNEAVFTSFVFQTFLKLANIQHQRINICALWQNGRIERLFGTLKPLLRLLVIPNKAALKQALQEFSLFYNHVRPHQNLHGLTPAESWHGLTMVDVQQTKGQLTRTGQRKPAQLVSALDGLLMGYYIKIKPK